jgi:hypothetical protein
VDTPLLFYVYTFLELVVELDVIMYIAHPHHEIEQQGIDTRDLFINPPTQI